LNALYVSLAVVGGLMLMLGMLGGLLIERTLISEPLIALLAGVLISPDVFGG
jgi:sodium/hydrogen antiporter